MSGNKSWPDLVGKSADEAVVAIQKEKKMIGIDKENIIDFLL
jgi:hypothetical protein